MKKAVMGFAMAMSFFHGIASACSMEDAQNVQIGDHEGVQGHCSNNGLRISCSSVQDGGILCDGPGGSYSGDDLNELIFSACGCTSNQEEKEKEQRALDERLD
jgi:hypothetical protein